MGIHKVADLLVKTLQQAGVKRIYGITGDSANFITDAISRSGIRFIHTRHEEVAALAAGAEALATGKLTACIGSCGPGSLHLINGLYEAHRNSAPVLAIATEIHKSQIGTRFVQEIDTRTVFRGCSHFCEYARTAEELPRMLGIAMQTAISKGGVSVLILTSEVSSAELENIPNPPYLPFYNHPVIHPAESEIAQLADELNSAKKITIYGGAGCAGAAKEVKELSMKLKAPLMWTYRAIEHLDWENPYPAGMAGILGTSAGDYALNHCDTLLLLGCGFAFTSMYPNGVKIIQIDLNGENLSRRHNISLGFVGDIKETLQVLLPLLQEKQEAEFANVCTAKYKKAQKHLLAIASQDEASKETIYPEHLTAVLNRKLPKDAWVASDIGTSWAFAGRYLESQGGRRFFSSSLHGTMAAAMPFSIGLSLANPQKQVVALCGDGGLTMLMGDLLTLKQEKVKPKLFVYNNSSLNFVAQEMKADGLPPAYTQLENPNFSVVARSMGLKGIRVEKVSELEKAIEEALESDEAVLVDIVVNPLCMLIPPHITVGMAEKYSHYVARMVKDRNTEQLLQEALVNLRMKDK